MIAAFALILILCLYKVKVSAKDGFADYMSPQKTGAIKGIFVLIVVFSHMRQYVEFERGLFVNDAFYFLMEHIGQLMVVVFLFYSGYGIMQAVEKKGKAYIFAMPKHRILKTYLHFAVAVLLYIIYNLCVGTTYPATRIVHAFLAWKSVGNSSWFMFAVFVLYIATFIGFALTRCNRIAGTCAVTVLTLVYIVVMWKVVGDKEHWFYDTVICYPLGMWYSLAKPKIDKVLLPSFWKWLAAMLLLLGALGALHILFKGQHPDNRLAFMLEVPVFALAVAVFTMRVGICNAALCWCGKRVFSIYILQKLPMMALKHFGVAEYPYVFAVVALVLSLVLAEVFDRILAKGDKLLKL